MKNSTSGSQVKWCVTCMLCSLWTLRRRAWRIVQPRRLLCSTVVCSTGLGIGQTVHCSRFVSCLTYGPLCLVLELCGYRLVNDLDGCNFLLKTHTEDLFITKWSSNGQVLLCSHTHTHTHTHMHMHAHTHTHMRVGVCKLIIIPLPDRVTGHQNLECCNDSWPGCHMKLAVGWICVLLRKEPA